jgi:hypothetical protein
MPSTAKNTETRKKQEPRTQNNNTKNLSLASSLLGLWSGSLDGLWIEIWAGVTHRRRSAQVFGVVIEKHCKKGKRQRN